MITTRTNRTIWFAAGAVVSLLMSTLALQAWRADAAPGDSDTTFVPITPCRLVDTRPAPQRVGPSGTLTAADTTTVQATGSNGNCVLPADAVGLSMNVTALNATELSFLTFWPDGPLPLAASLNPAPGEPPTPNAVTVDLSPAGAFNIYNASGNVDVVVDVTGYHTSSSLKEIQQRLLNLENANLGPRIAALETAAPPVVLAHAESGNLPESIFGGGPNAIALSTTIHAPGPGQLVMTAWTDASVSGTASDRIRCHINLDGTFVGGSGAYSLASSAGSGHTQNWEENCSTTVAAPVSAGTHTVEFELRDRASALFDDTALWVLWVGS